MAELTAQLDADLTLLWRRVVRTSAGEQAIPVDFHPNWAIFRADIAESFEAKALGRYNNWINPKKRGRDATASGSGKGSRGGKKKKVRSTA